MARATVTALQPLVYEGRSYVRGERFEVDALRALQMKRRGQVTLTRGANIPIETPDPPPVRRRRGAGTYQRRDMVAESSE